MNAIVLSSPRSLSKPRQYEIVKYTPAAATILTGMAAAAVWCVRGVTTLATRVKDMVTAPRRQARWVASRQVESPEPFSFAVPAPLAEPRQVKVTKFLDIFD